MIDGVFVGLVEDTEVLEVVAVAVLETLWLTDKASVADFVAVGETVIVGVTVLVGVIESVGLAVSVC